MICPICKRELKFDSYISQTSSNDSGIIKYIEVYKCECGRVFTVDNRLQYEEWMNKP